MTYEGNLFRKNVIKVEVHSEWMNSASLKKEGC